MLGVKLNQSLFENSIFLLFLNLYLCNLYEAIKKDITIYVTDATGFIGSQNIFFLDNLMAVKVKLVVVTVHWAN